MQKKTVMLSILGNIKDARGGKDEARWNSWRPNIALVQQPELPIDELHLVFDANKFEPLADRVRADIARVSPKTRVVYEQIALRDPWDFEEVYAAFHDLAAKDCFHREGTDLYIHISTGSHVEQICLFLLAESRHLPGRLVQTSPNEGHGRGAESHDSKGHISVIDLDLSRYDKLAKRFEAQHLIGVDSLKRGIATRNKAFNRLIETIERVAVRSRRPILLTGPTGAGKTQLARQIHALKKSNGQLAGKYVGVNCAALIHGDLAKSTLFGHKKNSFTGANADHDGVLKEADGGILFLDEIGELPLEVQAMLLKAIEEKTFRPLGAAKDETSDFQLICGTNRDLNRDAEAGKFRRDLLARINLWSFRLPGLAERREDIEPNLAFELANYRDQNGTLVNVTFNKEAYARFLAFALDPATTWSGNFRDLNGMVVRMATLAEGGRITAADVEDEIARYREQCGSAADTGRQSPAPAARADLSGLLGADYASRYDRFDLAQLADVVAVCRESDTMAAAAKKLFAVSRAAKTSSNDSDRLSKYLAKFGLKFKAIKEAHA